MTQPNSSTPKKDRVASTFEFAFWSAAFFGLLVFTPLTALLYMGKLALYIFSPLTVFALSFAAYSIMPDRIDNAMNAVVHHGKELLPKFLISILSWHLTLRRKLSEPPTPFVVGDDQVLPQSEVDSESADPASDEKEKLLSKKAEEAQAKLVNDLKQTGIQWILSTALSVIGYANAASTPKA